MATERRIVWTNPSFSVGTLVAVFVLVFDIVLKVMGGIGLVECLAIAAICAIRL